jgi:hypothetical protein
MTPEQWERLPGWVRVALTRRMFGPDDVTDVEFEVGVNREPKLIRVKLKPRVEVIRVDIVRETP